MSDFSISDHRQLPAISEQEEAEFLDVSPDEEAGQAAVNLAEPDELAQEPENPDAVPEVSDDPYDLPDDLLNLIEGVNPDELEEIDDLEEGGTE